MASAENLINGRFRILKKISSDNQPTTFKIFDLNDYAIKVAKQISIETTGFELRKKEAETLKKFNSDYIVKYLDFHLDLTKFYIIMKFYEDTLDDILKRNQTEKIMLPNEKIHVWSIQLLKGLEFLHSNSIWHRDIRPTNIYLKNNDLVLGDIGEARDTRIIMLNSEMGSIQYMSPEIVNESIIYTEKIDVWSFGCVLYEMIKLRKVFEKETLKENLNAIRHFSIEYLSIYLNDMKPLYRDLIKKSLVTNPDERMSAKELIEALEGNGIQTVVYANGDKYEGEIKNGKRHGKGTYQYTNGNRYKGEWKDNKRNGTGIFHYKVDPWNGDIYEGEFKDDKRHGNGTYYHENGNRFVGEWKNGRKNGQGILYFVNDDRFESEYKDDLINGKGVCFYANGDRYEGEYKDDALFGIAIYYYANGNRYEGEWKNSMKNGKGIFYYANGEKYYGEWRDNQKDGFGSYYFPNRTRYEGEFKNDKRNGKGAFYFANGNVYIGDWKEDKENGKGIFYLNLGPWRGDRYEGEWKDGKLNGKGTYFARGKKLDGFWLNGKLINYM